MTNKREGSQLIIKELKDKIDNLIRKRDETINKARVEFVKFTARVKRETQLNIAREAKGFKNQSVEIYGWDLADVSKEPRTAVIEIKKIKPSGNDKYLFIAYEDGNPMPWMVIKVLNSKID